jgi:type I restriction enzyme S subunit
MNRYNSYKDSGVEWIGDIPEHWGVSKSKYNFNVINGFAFKSDDFQDTGATVIRIGDLKPPFVDLSKAKCVELSKYKEIQSFSVGKGDLLLAMTGATIGKTATYNYDTISYLNQRVGLIRANSKNSKYFVKYILETKSFKEFVVLQSSGSAQENISKSQLGEFDFISPPPNEQEQIVAYLDKKTAIVDTLIASKEEKISLLEEKRTALINQVITKGLDPNVELKDSGVEWIGEIPQHWEKLKIRRITDEHRQGYYSDNGYTESGYRVVRITDIKNNNIIDVSDSPFYELTEEDENRYKLEKGDFLFQRTGSDKKIGYFQSEEPSVYASFLIRFRFKNINPRFLIFYFNSDLYQIQLNEQIHGGVNPNIHAENIKDCFIFVPPSFEQNEISNYLEVNTQQIDQIISIEEKKIETLKDYRQALISEVVTGKIKVVK